MNLDRIGQFAAGVIIAAALAGNLDRLNRWVYVATAKLLYESRTSTWGSPIFWPENENRIYKPITTNQEVRYAKTKNK